MNKYIVFMGIGFELLGLVGVGVYISSVLEAKYQSNGVITAGVLILCLVLWMIHLIILMKKTMNKKND